MKRIMIGTRVITRDNVSLKGTVTKYLGYYKSFDVEDHQYEVTWDATENFSQPWTIHWPEQGIYDLLDMISPYNVSLDEDLFIL